MKANEMQVGGNHYKTAYEHWDLVVAVGMGYFEGQATKYISRWRKKNGLQDLQKALHYINKLVEVRLGYKPTNRIDPLSTHEEIARFVQVNELTELECLIVEELAVWKDENDLIKARDMTLLLMDEAQPKPVPATDSNRHTERVDSLNESEKLGYDGPRQIDRTGR